MKLMIIATLMGLTMLSSAVYAFEYNKTSDKPVVVIKRVCKEVLDRQGNIIINKDGTTKKSCRIIRVYKNKNRPWSTEANNGRTTTTV